MLLQFTRNIEQAGQNGVTEELHKKSQMLIEHILRRKDVEKEGILSSIAKVHFIVPQKVCEWNLSSEGRSSYLLP